jgi:hypothetical protein
MRAGLFSEYIRGMSIGSLPLFPYRPVFCRGARRMIVRAAAAAAPGDDDESVVGGCEKMFPPVSIRTHEIVRAIVFQSPKNTNER